MWPRILLVLFILLIGGIFAVHVTGCSLIGLGVGAILDSEQPNTAPASMDRLGKVDPDRRIELVRIDSATIQGRFAGLRSVPPVDYRAQYDAWRASLGDSLRLPDLDARIRVVTRTGEYRTAQLRGFGHRSVVLEDAKKGVSEIPLDDLVSLAPDSGASCLAESLLARWTPASNPDRLRIQVMAGDQTFASVSPDSVAQVNLETIKHGAMVGFLVGAGVDLLVFLSYEASKNLESGCETPQNTYERWLQTHVRGAGGAGSPIRTPPSHRSRRRW